MRFTTRLGCCLAAAALLATSAPAVSQAAATPAAPPRSAERARAVTLITGDRVRVSASGGVTVQAGKGRARMSFVKRRVGKDLVVIPVDALPLLQAGRLDQRLFDVTTLLDFGYDDRRADLPLIVSYEDVAGATEAAPLRGARAVRALPAAGAQSVRVTKSDGGMFWRALTAGQARPRALAGATSKVWLDGLRKPTLDESVRQIGAPSAWQAGYTGAGVKVAVLDTGVDTSHPDLADRVIARANFTDDPDARDLVGHGTHVASTIAGSGKASHGQYAGVAPGAKVLDGKVCVVDGCAESWILAGMQWAAAEQHARVVNLSLGGPDTPDTDPLEAAVNRLTARYGTVCVIAAGNSGSSIGSVESPGSADAALTVGAVDKSD